MAGDFTTDKRPSVDPKDSAPTAAPTGTTPQRPARAISAPVSGPPSATPAQRTVKCPKCGADAREVARFCQRCHMTLRFTCPACKNEQRKGGTCEKCGVDFLKYITAVVDAKKDTRDVAQDRFDRRTSLVKNVLLIPITGGLSLLGLLRPKKDNSK
jgi:hypothetical protein